MDDIVTRVCVCEVHRRDIKRAQIKLAKFRNKITQMKQIDRTQFQCNQRFWCDCVNFD